MCKVLHSPVKNTLFFLPVPMTSPNNREKIRINNNFFRLFCFYFNISKDISGNCPSNDLADLNE